MANSKNSYRLFKASLFPALPYLLYSAQKVRQSFPIPPSISEEIRFKTLSNKNSKLLILGESTAAGVGAEDISETLAGHFNKLFQNKYHILNLGKNGIRAKELWPYFHRTLKKEKGDFKGILIFIGANDCFKLSSPLQFRSALLKLIEQLEAHFNPEWIYLADIPPVQLFPAFPPLLKYYLRNQQNFLCKEMEWIANKNPKIIFKKINLNLNADFFCKDQVHPSGKGYKAIADFSFKCISERLQIKP